GLLDRCILALQKLDFAKKSDFLTAASSHFRSSTLPKKSSFLTSAFSQSRRLSLPKKSSVAAMIR
ncbi:MAG: hypothetical protein KDI03_07460, partial [Anaerolineae bacterium]|nr:hypothetical protein [Anaerolineae bacterium]